MAYQEGDERKYFSAVFAALIVIAIAVGTFVYTLVQREPAELDPIYLESVDPSGTQFPTGPPSVPAPTGPPPIPLNN